MTTPANVGTTKSPIELIKRECLGSTVEHFTGRSSDGRVNARGMVLMESTGGGVLVVVNTMPSAV